MRLQARSASLAAQLRGTSREPAYARVRRVSRPVQYRRGISPRQTGQETGSSAAHCQCTDPKTGVPHAPSHSLSGGQVLHVDLPEGGAADSSAGGGAELAAALAGAAEALRKRFPEMFKESQATDTPRTQGTSQNSRRLFWLSRMLKESQATDKPRTPGTSRRCHKGLVGDAIRD